MGRIELVELVELLIVTDLALESRLLEDGVDATELMDCADEAAIVCVSEQTEVVGVNKEQGRSQTMHYQNTFSAGLEGDG